jgi:hypothetical protein
MQSSVTKNRMTSRAECLMTKMKSVSGTQCRSFTSDFRRKLFLVSTACAQQVFFSEEHHIISFDGNVPASEIVLPNQEAKSDHINSMYQDT